MPNFYGEVTWKNLRKTKTMFAPAKMVARRAVRAVEAANAAIIMRRRGRRHPRQ